MASHSSLLDSAFEDEIGPDGKKICPGINPVMIDELTECNTMLSVQRKKRQVPPTLASTDAIERYAQISSHPLHFTRQTDQAFYLWIFILQRILPQNQRTSLLPTHPRSHRASNHSPPRRTPPSAHVVVLLPF